MNERIGQDGKYLLNRTKEVSVNVVPSVDANSSRFKISIKSKSNPSAKTNRPVGSRFKISINRNLIDTEKN
jgi:hypothetical protein